jgi:hypothetical protein
MIIWLAIMSVLAIFPLLFFVFELSLLQDFMPPLAILLFLVVMGVAYRVYYVTRRGDREKMMARIRELEEQLAQQKK